MLITRRLRAGGVVLALVVLVPLCGVELLYRHGLAHVGELPRLAPEPHVGHLQRALWAAEEGGRLHVAPVWPWTILSRFSSALRQPLRPDASPGDRFTGWCARLWLADRRLRTLERHGHRLIVSIWLSRNASAEQLTVFAAERAYFGRGAHGARAAARAYFGVEAEQLTWAQAALLAGLLQAPSRLDPAVRPAEAARRRNWVLDRLRASGVLSPPEYQAALAEPLLPPPALTGPNR